MSAPLSALAVPAVETSAPYAYHVRAVDPDGDRLTYLLSSPDEE